MAKSWFLGLCCQEKHVCDVIWHTIQESKAFEIPYPNPKKFQLAHRRQMLDTCCPLQAVRTEPLNICHPRTEIQVTNRGIVTVHPQFDFGSLRVKLIVQRIQESRRDRPCEL